MKTFRMICGALAVAVAALSVVAPPVTAQWSTTHEQYYLPGSFNWQFRKNYPSADGLFNAFDYGHAILYERLWSKPGAPVGLLENDEFAFITKKLLVNPPNLPLEESAIETGYVKIAPEAKQMFDWAHLLHRQIYDVLADERMNPAQKDAKVAELLRYYKSRKDLAFSSRPKSMDLMEGQPYSLAFRKRYPKFNGLIWAYHWLQIGLYEPLLAGRNRDERQTGVLAAVSRFRQMIEQPPTWMPRVMPMTPAVAPLLTARYPEAAIIFDNLHSMHDVISDVLANPSVSRDQKRAEILKAAKRYRDDSSFVTTQEEWREMAAMMGVENMGGPAVGFLAAFPTPTVERGAVMSHESMPGMRHSAAASPTDSAKSAEHSSMDHSSHPAASGDSAAVADVIKRYHSALETGDSASALVLLSPDVTILESGGIETRSEYRLHHLPGDIAFARAVKSTRSPISVTVSGSTAWATSTSTVVGEFKGRAINSSGAETMILTRDVDGWRIRSIHWSSRTRRPAK